MDRSVRIEIPFDANRPFFYIMVHKSDTLLFIGHIKDPIRSA